MDKFREFTIAIKEHDKDAVIKLLTSDDSMHYINVLLFNNTDILDYAFKYYNEGIIKILLEHMLENNSLNFNRYISISIFNRNFDTLIKILNFPEISELITDFNILLDVIRVYTPYNGSDKVFKILFKKCKNLDPSYGNNLLLLYSFDKHYITLINVLLNDKRVIKTLKFSDIPTSYSYLLFDKLNIKTEKELETALQLI